MKPCQLLLTFCLLTIFETIHMQTDDELHPNFAPPKEWKPKKITELDSEYWIKQAQQYLLEKLEQQAKPNRNKAKNIILFMGDGMSLNTVTATRSYLGDASTQLSFEQFPYFGLSRALCIDTQVPDSGCSATALLSGVQGNYRTVGVSAAVPFKDCTLGQNSKYHTESIAKWAQDAGKWTGLVTSGRVTHFSPAGLYAHAANKDWENDQLILDDKCSPNDNVDIARQLVEWPVGKGLRVIMGGGRRYFINETFTDEDGKLSQRLDGRNLISEWLEDKLKNDAKAQYVTNKPDLLQTNLKETDYLLGLFCPSHCPYHEDLERDGLTEKIPSLTEMTMAAIELLSRSKEGYFLFVEGENIDNAHRDMLARIALEDTEEFAHAVDVARSMTLEEDTLIVTTADHGQTMTINGYPLRTDDILGLNSKNAADELPYTILSFANGPGHEEMYGKNGREDFTGKNFTDPNRKYMATVPLHWQTHGGEYVGVYASGPFAHYFGGNYLQTDIPLLMAKAANIGPYR